MKEYVFRSEYIQQCDLLNNDCNVHFTNMGEFKNIANMWHKFVQMQNHIFGQAKLIFENHVGCVLYQLEISYAVRCEIYIKIAQ